MIDNIIRLIVRDNHKFRIIVLDTVNKMELTVFPETSKLILKLRTLFKIEPKKVTRTPLV